MVKEGPFSGPPVGRVLDDREPGGRVEIVGGNRIRIYHHTSIARVAILDCCAATHTKQRRAIIYLVGLVVIVMLILSVLGLR